ncbi:DUF4035 domain-containing protein [Klebsiella pneumoniae]|uniref:phage tail assembly protein T n=1 Tax=Klebsiella pneumoniae TaxID=573 RepID=UPI000949E86B|nr:DUF4035 domain-containing protein [Klebsiella pneumoniae]EIX9711369.1 DUF4035 domain-containing protein [Klebsiella pneumoniae]HDH0344350.1 DUF4035 domain-containing protein [Klebsiella pneumoniae]
MPGMQFLMALALRMGRTLGELRQAMTVGEFRLWAEYDRISPIGDVRGDILNAQLVSAIYGAQGGKIPIEEAQLRWNPDSDEISEDDDPFAGLEAALLAASEGR